ncbi:MAG TPA: 2,3-bisphosphoglycerate-independent phosphoglycerate mutase [Candidatus Saccharimonadales bacterium]|nr:2,3-bisphosphoglycerate-independent phosphoglycerate mutase [Candidatus Saccharimonadales bacterium]
MPKPPKPIATSEAGKLGSPAGPRPIVLCVMDGWGVAPEWGGNAVALAHTPFMNMATKTFPYTTLAASGEAVGLPDHDRGNSEVGHLNIGSGQVVQEAFPSITTAIKDGSFLKNPVLIKAFTNAKAAGKAVHIMGLCSDGGIHSHIDHLFALLDMAKSVEFTNVCIHAFTDGRDTAPFAAEEYLARVATNLKKLGFGRICTVEGRYYAMDRDHRWERIEKVYRAMTEGVGNSAKTAEAAVAAAYRDGFSDEFVPPTVIQGENNSFVPIQDGDSVIFFNFRGDRAREITQAIVKPDFDGFNRKKILQNVYFAGFTYYQEGLPMEVAFKPKDVKLPLSGVLSAAGLKQLHVAESEKYAHVTYFFNGGQEKAFTGEDRIVVPSPKVPSYDQVPAMSSAAITKTVLENLGKYDFIVLNYANPDMVGHTGNLRAAIQACEAVDAGLQQIFDAVNKLGGIFIVTADHGNVEQMVNPKTGEPDTEHTNSPVPFIIAGDVAKGWLLRQGGSLSDVAPTILTLFNLQKSPEMTGESLILKADEPAESVAPTSTPIVANTPASAVR